MYKVIQNNEIIDVLDTLHFVWKNPRNGVVLSCDTRKGQGIVSSDGSKIYRLPSGEKLGDYPEITLEEITPDEYQRLRDLLDGVEQTSDEEPTPSTAPGETDAGEEPQVREPMSIAEMREKIQWLEQAVDFITTMLGGGKK